MTECKAERKRAYAPKTRSGCKTCKLRRIKCDEAKPFCKRCTSTGRQCDGYNTNQQSLVSTRPKSILPKDPLTPSVGNAAGVYHLDFFAKEVGPKIAGFYADFDFWTVKIVQLGYTEPAIQVAIQAVSALHAEVEKAEGNTLTQVDPGILKQYNNAIRHLVQGSSDPLHVKAVIVALFVCLEFLVGNEDAAAIHINGGLKLIHDWRRRSSSSTPDSSDSSSVKSITASEHDIMDDLSAMFSRLGVHHKVFGKRMFWLEPDPAGDPNEYSYHFETLNQARNDAFVILGDGMEFVSRATPASYSDEGIDQSMYHEQGNITARILEWRKAFKIFERQEQMNLSQFQIRAGNMMQCLLICTYIWTCTCLTPYEEEYDKFTSEFEEVIKLGRTIVDIPQEFLCNKVGRFQIDMGLVPALHFVGTRCRVLSVRKAAAEMLSAYHWREGLFDSFRSAQFVRICSQLEEAAKQKLMGLETRELENYLPCEGARIHFVGIDKHISSEKGKDQLLHSFYSKPYGAYGDWHVQQCYLPSLPDSVAVATSTTKTQVVPGSAYQMPYLHMQRLKPDMHAFAHTNDAVFCPDVTNDSANGQPSMKFMNVMIPNSDHARFRMPHSATSTINEMSNGMFYMHFMGASPFSQQRKAETESSKHVHDVLL